MKYVIDCISDTHTLHRFIKLPEPEATGEFTWILVHAGDYTHRGRASEAADFATWFRDQPHPHKVVINGNHECYMDPVWRRKTIKQLREVIDAEDPMYPQRATAAKRILNEMRKPVHARPLFDFAHYLEDSEVVIEGLRFWGSPYSLEFNDFAYSVRPEDAEAKWATIPEGVDVLVVHGPPKWHGDRCPARSDPDKLVFVGDEALLKRIRQVKPKLMVCGHIHESAGVYVDQDTRAIIVNASMLEYLLTPTGVRMLPRDQFVRVVIDVDIVTATQTLTSPLRVLPRRP